MRSDEGLVTGGAYDVVLHGVTQKRAEIAAQCARTPVDRNVHFGAGQVAAVDPDYVVLIIPARA